MSSPLAAVSSAIHGRLLQIASALLLLALLPDFALPTMAQKQVLRQEEIAAKYFGADAPWFLRNIPFLDIDDPEIEQVYYYRWKLYRSHIREIGRQGTTELEFLEDVPWAKEPYTDLNDSSSFHLMEGRWLRNPAYVNSLIDHMYAGGGNTRNFSEWIAAASEAATSVTGDETVLLRNLAAMEYIFSAWDDHLDRKRSLYWVEPLADATEYTISSIDASGAGFTDHPDPDQGRNGFTQGFAYRPSINSYQYANALAVSHIAGRAGQPLAAAYYAERAEQIRKATLSQLWNDNFEHFTDRYQRSTPTVKAGEFIRGRELVGYVPWFFELPPKTGSDAAKYNASWSFLLSPKEFLGDAGLRTVGPGYPRYMVQYRYAGKQPECQWNGPSWPFQTSQTLTGLANLLDDYPQQDVITRADYLRLLRQYTRQHFLTPDHLDLQEDYNPDKGGPIVGLERSHHYAHSTYVDLILSGLIGIRPRSDNTLEIAPLLSVNASAGERPIHYFAVQGICYHGHEVAVIYDDSGEHYRLGKGLSIYVDGKKASGPGALTRTLVPLKPIEPSRLSSGISMPEDIAVNVGLQDGPQATASSSINPESAKQAIDGRLWFFPENANGWSPDPVQSEADSWWAVQLPRPRKVRSVELYFFADGTQWLAPQSFRLQYRVNDAWTDVPGQFKSPETTIANGKNSITFPAITTDTFRVLLPGSPKGASIRLIEFEAFEEPRP